jgi:kynurenine 3-monooxygenase
VAHAIVPFFGQGMNCGFEDCRILDELIEKNGDDWTLILQEYQTLRKPDADAIAVSSL